MVQITSKFLALSAIFATTYALSLPKRDVTQVETDIASISTQVNALNTTINAYPTTGGSIAGALVCNFCIYSYAPRLIRTCQGY